MQRLNVHLQELIVAVLKGGASADSPILLKEIQEVTGRARQEQRLFEKTRAEFSAKAFSQVPNHLDLGGAANPWPILPKSNGQNESKIGSVHSLQSKSAVSID